MRTPDVYLSQAVKLSDRKDGVMSLLKKRLALCACALLLTLPLGGCVGETAEALPSPAPAVETMEDEAMVMEVRIGEQVFSATLADSTAARALAGNSPKQSRTAIIKDSTLFRFFITVSFSAK